MKRIFYTCIVLFACWQTSFAQAGLDPTFWNGGLVTTNFGIGTHDEVNRLAVQQDGKIVVAGSSFGEGPVKFARYKTDGTLDTDFGVGGKVEWDIYKNFDQFRITDLEIMSDGKILAAGIANRNIQSIDEYQGVKFIIRFLPNGSLDLDFSLDGYYVASLSDKFSNVKYEDASVGIRTDGSVLLAAGRYGRTEFTVLSTTGDVLNSLEWQGFAAYDLVVLPLDEFVICGQSNDDFVWAKFSANASNIANTNPVDFGGTDQPVAMVVQADGKFILTGYSLGNGLAVARYNSNGSLDNSFSGDGKFSSGSLPFSNSIALQQDGKIVIGLNSPSFSAVRLLENGQLDPCFGQAGKLTVDFPGDFEGCFAVAVQQDGKILMAGNAYPGDNSDFALARYISPTPTQWYLDADGDGYGSDNSMVESCITPSPRVVKVDPACVDFPPFVTCQTKIIYWVTTGGDCNDNSAAVRPGATEICDGFDNDCNGQIDEGLPTTAYYSDADGDGYGTGTAQQFCSNPGAGYATQGGDCNDANASIHPSATGSVELCDGIDNDCDGVIDEGCSGKPTLSISDVTVYESEGKAMLTIKLSHITTLQVKVGYATGDGTAVSNKKEKDYKSIGSTMLTIPPGTLSTTITVPVYNDGKTENNEYFYVNLSKPTNCLLSDVSGMVTILDGAPITIARNNVSATVRNGLREQTEISLQAKAFPNPSASSFTVTVDGGDGTPVDVRIFNSMGQVVKALRSSDRILRLGDELQKGIYILEVRQGSNRKTIKLVKQ